MKKIRTLLTFCLSIALLFTAFASVSAAAPTPLPKYAKAIKAFDGKAQNWYGEINKAMKEYSALYDDMESSAISIEDYNDGAMIISSRIRTYASQLELIKVDATGKSFKADTIKGYNLMADKVFRSAQIINADGSWNKKYNKAAFQKKDKELVAFSTAFKKKYFK